MGGDDDIHVQGHDEVGQAFHHLVRRAVMAAEVGADLLLALVEQVVVERGHGIDDQGAVVVLLGEQRFHLRQHLVHVVGLKDGRAAGGDQLVVVLGAALGVDDVAVGELDGGGGLADASGAEHEQLQPLGDGLRLLGAKSGHGSDSFNGTIRAGDWFCLAWRPTGESRSTPRLFYIC